MKYEATITAIGSLAGELLENSNSIIMLDEGARPSLSEMVVEHTQTDLKEDIKVGDTLHMGNKKFKVVTVGDMANENIRKEGHCTLVFNDEGSMPGQIVVKGTGAPRLLVGDTITFE
ncbi:hypothetical protein TAMA11512_02820 [Selenomonas sp. TAMA-11512]|uniref:PTS glucitol/sorbitol transporter subunit IIA n=1 Tax=Selenomonas sp. TAMA-11512 TaxID=3095337 RepID=UPI003084DFAB|nr:hypothetical protein TAMA11512_02820 [Selenomonas sp. TAMA-11512]